MEIYLQKRKKIEVKINNLKFITAVIKHKSSGYYFEKYSLKAPFYLPEFTKDEVMYIYADNYYPAILFHNPQKNKIIQLEKADSFCFINLTKTVSQKSLFSNNVVPDGYFAFKYGNKDMM